MRTHLASRAGLLSLATAAALTLAPAVPAAQARTAPTPPTAATAPGTALALPGTEAAAAYTVCRRWSSDRRLAVRPCLRVKNNQGQPQGAFRNKTNRRITITWKVAYQTTNGAWRVCKHGRGSLKPRQHWVTWCGWYKKVANVYAGASVVR